MKNKQPPPAAAADLRRRAEARLGVRRSKAGVQKSGADTLRLLQELEVHHIELELQNAELQNARNELEGALEKYTDLYDFAPVAYCSLDETGAILDANLTCAAWLGGQRSKLLGRRLPLFVCPASRPDFMAFLKNAFTGLPGQTCEAQLQKQDGGTFWAGLRATPAVSHQASGKWCRVAFGDITERRLAEAAQHRLEVLAATNQKLAKEIVRREQVESALQNSEQHQRRLLAESRHMQEMLRRLSHQILHAQEEERKRISRELHDEIAQTLVGINVHLAALSREAADDPAGLPRKLAHTRRLVEKSVDVVHRFARELRPAALDDLGLVPALHAFLKEFTKRTGVRASLKAFAGVEKLDASRRTVLFRVAQEALTNVARHAKASRVEVGIEKLADGIRMKIKDDGKSFRVAPTLPANGGKRLGLLGMRERLEMVGGAFEIESVPGQGTTIVAQIPLARLRRGGGGGGISAGKTG